MILDEEEIDVLVPAEVYTDSFDGSIKEERKNKKNRLLKWFKLRKKENLTAALAWPEGEKSSGSKSFTSQLTPLSENTSAPVELATSNALIADAPPVCADASEDYSAQEKSLTSLTSTEQVELLREQVKILSGEVALHTSILKRLSDELANNPNNEQIQVEMIKVSNEIKKKSGQIASLETQLSADKTYSELREQLSEKSFELEVKTADNRVIQDQLNEKIHECDGLREVVASLSRQLEELKAAACCPKQSDLLAEARNEMIIQSQATELEDLKRKLRELTDHKAQLETRNQRLADECSYAKGLASAAGSELKALSEEVAKLMAHNHRLSAAAAAPPPSRTPAPARRGALTARPARRDSGRGGAAVNRRDSGSGGGAAAFEAALLERERREAELQRRVDEAERREAHLENELASMWVLVAKLKKPLENEAPETSTD